MALDMKNFPVMEMFYSLQGEGYHQGSAAFFIRLAGCDVGCVWCDVKESWDKNEHPVFSVEHIVQQAGAAPCKKVIITGGEPAMYDLTELTHSLKEEGKLTHLETSGVYPLTGKWDWICFSPKKFKKPERSVYSVAHELKIIVFHPSDLAWAEEHARLVNKDCYLYLQPEWSRVEEISPLIVDYAKANPQWRISLQQHKYIHIP